MLWLDVALSLLAWLLYAPLFRQFVGGNEKEFEFAVKRNEEKPSAVQRADITRAICARNWTRRSG